MNGLDTSVLVRYLTQDGAAQAQKAAKCVTSVCTAKDPCQIDRLVLCELMWVLESGYGYPP
jgi:predicted nucleic-acid-binding protein